MIIIIIIIHLSRIQSSRRRCAKCLIIDAYFIFNPESNIMKINSNFYFSYYLWF